jgi:hypothetical protein
MNRWTTAQYKAYVERGESKYHNQKTEIDGMTFDSKAEAQRYNELVWLWSKGEISGFTRQPSFELSPGVRYRPDFMVCDKSGHVWVEDVKGVETPAFKIKRRLWESKFPWLELKIIK